MIIILTFTDDFYMEKLSLGL